MLSGGGIKGKIKVIEEGKNAKGKNAKGKNVFKLIVTPDSSTIIPENDGQKYLLSLTTSYDACKTRLKDDELIIELEKKRIFSKHCMRFSNR